MGLIGCKFRGPPNGKTIVGAVVVIFTVTVAGAPLGVTDADEGMHVASEGAPVQVMATAALNPPAGVTCRL